ncbi:MAG TPA: sugar phosphate isomerase/epimerase, partial [Burkholderiales bacterium]|nr:sugar phosphate isomerase/epimerase [Burkholderiales bacterium]
MAKVSRKIGLAALTVLELPHHEQVSVAAQAGYSHVGLRLNPVAGQPFHHTLDVNEVEKRLADTGVRVFDVEVFRLTPETKINELESIIATAARLRATELLVHGADPDAIRLTESFARLCDLAAGYGLSANLEPMPWVDVSNLAKAQRVLDAAGRKNSGLLVDAIHFFRAGDSPGALAKVGREVLRYMQLCDAPPERPSDMQEIIRQARSDRLFPGEGGLDLRG